MDEKSISQLGVGYVKDYQKCEYEGRRYYYHNGYWLNSAFVRVSQEEGERLNIYFHKNKKATLRIGTQVVKQQQVPATKKKGKKKKRKRKENGATNKVDYDDRNFDDAMEYRVPGDMFRG